MTDAKKIHPPETLEGWYALHQLFAHPVGLTPNEKEQRDTAALLNKLAKPDGGGWSAVARVIGSVSDTMMVHFRPTLDAIGEVQRELNANPYLQRLVTTYTFLSITEAGLYHITAELARDAVARGGSVGDEEYVKAVKARVDAERGAPMVARRLEPPFPAEMPYVSFYPMSKKREAGQNWYALTLDERSRMMYEHGTTGRKYHGRVQQIITGAIGFDAWEWGVTLFAKDPLDFKKLVTEMRFDEASARYVDFGEFWVGKVMPPEEWVRP
ncbi:MAG: chlorite dismutase family protein [Gemmatimonadaceae bacterium]|nr:chlorite dismutase family protein [Gemmatimonadaceae bacterium]